MLSISGPPLLTNPVPNLRHLSAKRILGAASQTSYLPKVPFQPRLKFHRRIYGNQTTQSSTKN
jgi:hypothetical protein